MSAMEVAEESETYLFVQKNLPQVYISLYTIKKSDSADISYLTGL
jgi:hypothetical protein